MVGDRRLRPQHRRHQVARAARDGQAPAAVGFRPRLAHTGLGEACSRPREACCSRRPVRTARSAPTIARRAVVWTAGAARGVGRRAGHLRESTGASSSWCRWRLRTAGTRRASRRCRRRPRARTSRSRCPRASSPWRNGLLAFFGTNVRKSRPAGHGRARSAAGAADTTPPAMSRGTIPQPVH